MAGREPSAEQLRKELREALKLFVRHRATKDDRSQAAAPGAPLRMQCLSCDSGIGFEPQGLSLPLLASNRAALRAAKAVEPLHEKALFSYEFGEAAPELQDEQDGAFDTVARELDAIATAINERYGCGNSQDGESQTKGYFLSAVSGLVSGAATTFRIAVTQCVHTELPEMHQLALLFHVAAAAMEQVGSDAYKAQRITDMTVDYAYDNYGDYIAANGGLENAVTHT